MKIFYLVKYVCCLSLIALSLSCKTVDASQTVMTSPSGTYTVSFSDEIEPRQGLMFENRAIRFSLVKNGTLMIDRELFARDKASKLPRFIEKYPYQEWRAENALRLGKQSTLSDSECNEVSVSNLTSNAIDYFDVVTFYPERFIIFDLSPNSTVKLYSQPENAPSLTFLAGGKFSGGQGIKRVQVNYQLPENSRSVGHFCITITEQGVSINSREYEGVFYDTTELSDAIRKMTPENFAPDDLPKPREIRVPRNDCRIR